MDCRRLQSYVLAQIAAEPLRHPITITGTPLVLRVVDRPIPEIERMAEAGQLRLLLSLRDRLAWVAIAATDEEVAVGQMVTAGQGLDNWVNCLL